MMMMMVEPGREEPGRVEPGRVELVMNVDGDDGVVQVVVFAGRWSPSGSSYSPVGGRRQAAYADDGDDDDVDDDAAIPPAAIQGNNAPRYSFDCFNSKHTFQISVAAHVCCAQK